MSLLYKKKISKRDMPKDFEDLTVKTIHRIAENHTVAGVLFLRNGVPEMYTVTETLAQNLSTKLPPLHESMHRAITEIDIMDELVAFRIQTKTIEILVVADKEFTACVVHKVKNKQKTLQKAFLTRKYKHSATIWIFKKRINNRNSIKYENSYKSIKRLSRRMSSLINNVNPVIDRIMEDESVEGVIMTNKEGAPILTNISVTRATQYGLALHKLGNLTQQCIRELDPFDKTLVMRLNTKKIEMIMAPDLEFNIIIIQHFRHKTKENKLESHANKSY